MNKLTWKEAYFYSPGPRAKLEFLLLFAKGMAMGAADLVPGVSGGTVAFITGIYKNLMNAVKSINLKFFLQLLKFQIKEALCTSHFRFLLTLVSGILFSIFVFANLISFLLQNQAIYTWSLFFGLILSSIFIIGEKIKNIWGSGGLGLLIGSFIGFIIVNIIPTTTPEYLWFIFISGIIAITAMILPGISGSFLLLLIGKYEFILNAAKNPLQSENIIILVIFASGCLIGVITISRIIAKLFDKNYNLTLAILTGLIIGSIKKIWPLKEAIDQKIINGEVYTIAERNVLPEINKEFFIAIFIMFIGYFIVQVLNNASKKKEKTVEEN
ncbi:DUF368 domain-containing protein [Candidatus Parcubacteria bacterium]|nr:MAG: DUF368 domain-containing protein [Candidatus Parcubacteria bacterium]